MILILFKKLRKLKKYHCLFSSDKASDQEKVNLEMQSFFIDMTKTVVERWSSPCADEFAKLLYEVATRHGVMNEETFKAIVDIIPSEHHREKVSTTVKILNVNQVNINPNNVINFGK